MEKCKTFYEQAIDCQKRSEQKINGNESKYLDTLFVKIDDKNEVLASETPDILTEEAKCCILVHRYEQLAQTNRYSWYEVEFIDANHGVHTNKIDERFKLFIDYKDRYDNQVMRLYADGTLIYSCKWPDESQLKVVWDLYQACQSCETTREAKLLGDLVRMDQSILELKRNLANKNYMALLLQKERDQYKSLLDEIKELIQKD